MDISEICRRVAGHPKDVSHAFEQLHAVRLGLLYWGRKRRGLVAYLRDHKVSWQEIADVLQVTPSAVYQWFTRNSPQPEQSDS